jgi:hypothetical protein
MGGVVRRIIAKEQTDAVKAESVSNAYSWEAPRKRRFTKSSQNCGLEAPEISVKADL